MTDSLAAANDAPANAADLTTKLESLKASATKEYSLKNYTAAAEFYSEAAELQDQINGEMSPENADILYQYGRCLYHVAVANSDVLGGKVASAEEPKRKKRKVAPAESSAAGAANGAGASGLIGDAMKDGEQKMAEEVVEAAVEEKEGVAQKQKDESMANKPFFNITGDENWTDSEDEDDDAADAEAEEEEDDFATAYEILDVARVLLIRKLEASQQTDGSNGKAAAKDTAEQRQLKERLADTHDLQAEISLENERFVDAITDTRESLTLKLGLYPQESSLIAEAHFKLSLALEFASVTSTADETTGEQKVSGVDEEMRKEAAQEMEKAIASCNLRIQKETEALTSLPADKKSDQEKSIADVKDMVGDMKNRLTDLRNPAVSLSASEGLGPAGAGMEDDPIRGVLGQLLGESKPEKEKRIKEATEGANDLSGLVKHRKKPKVEDAAAGNGEVAVEGKGKRKAEDGEAASGSGNGKKVKFEDAA